MNSPILFLLFVGLLLVVVGVYEQRLERERKTRKIEYKFVPRTYFEDQHRPQDLGTKYAPIFDDTAEILGLTKN